MKIYQRILSQGLKRNTVEAQCDKDTPKNEDVKMSPVNEVPKRQTSGMIKKKNQVSIIIVLYINIGLNRN